MSRRFENLRDIFSITICKADGLSKLVAKPDSCTQVDAAGIHAKLYFYMPGRQETITNFAYRTGQINVPLIWLDTCLEEFI